MMSDLNIQMCPETGICSIIKDDGTKIDLMPDEVGQIRDASGQSVVIRQALSDVDSGFAEGLNAEELEQVSSELK